MSLLEVFIECLLCSTSMLCDRSTSESNMYIHIYFLIPVVTLEKVRKKDEVKLILIF